jgi:cytochrome c-type biogenesis protein CcmE
MVFRSLIVALLLLACGSKSDEVEVHGYIEAGSIRVERVGQSSVYSFVLERRGVRVDAVMVAPVPDFIRDNAEVLAIGKMDGPTLEVRELRGGCFPRGTHSPTWCDQTE